jgi:hypothetical protein
MRRTPAGSRGARPFAAIAARAAVWIFRHLTATTKNAAGPRLPEKRTA